VREGKAKGIRLKTGEKLGATGERQGKDPKVDSKLSAGLLVVMEGDGFSFFPFFYFALSRLYFRFLNSLASCLRLLKISTFPKNPLSYIYIKIGIDTSKIQ
jgi:hypothetical protein